MNYYQSNSSTLISEQNMNDDILDATHLDYRIIYQIEDESQVVRVVKIRHRSEIYRRQ